MKFSLIASTAALAATTQAGKCPFGFDKKSDDNSLAQVSNNDDVTNGPRYPDGLFGTGGIEVTPQTFNEDSYKKVANLVIAHYDGEADSVKQSRMAGCLVRFVGHDIMDFVRAKGQGGADGCIDLHDPDNLGLHRCLTSHGIPGLYDQVKQEVSRADFMVIAAEALMGRTATNYDDADRFGEDRLLGQFMRHFKYGRKTANTCPEAEGLMPNPTHGCPGMQNVFEKNVFANEKEPYVMTAALLGAHTLGSADPATSGFEGTWSDQKNQGIFNNDFYRSLLTKGWAPEKNVGGREGKNQWRRVDKGADPNHKEMMLDTDMCLAFATNIEIAHCRHIRGQCGICNKIFKDSQTFDINANNGECCAWVTDSFLGRKGVYKKGETNTYCGKDIKNTKELKGSNAKRRQCCDTEDHKKSFGDCNDIENAAGVAGRDVVKFARSERRFYHYFLQAWHIATNNNFSLHELFEGAGKFERFEWTDEENFTREGFFEEIALEMADDWQNKLQISLAEKEKIDALIADMKDSSKSREDRKAARAALMEIRKEKSKEKAEHKKNLANNKKMRAKYQFGKA